MPTATITGAIGEMIACSVIMGFDGWSAAHVPTDGYDLVAFDEVGALRIQVKSGMPRAEKDGRMNCYHFNNGTGAKKQLRHDQYDILCHCSLLERRCIFYAASSVNKTSQRYSLSAFDNLHKEYDSWKRAVHIVREGFC